MKDGVKDCLENTVLESAADHYKSILDAFCAYNPEFTRNHEAHCAIFVHAIFFECFMVGTDLLGRLNNRQEADRVLERLLFRSLDRAFTDGGTVQLTQRGLNVIDHLAGVNDMVVPSEGLFVSDCVVRRFWATINEALGRKESLNTYGVFYSTTACHLLSGCEAQVYHEIAKLLAADPIAGSARNSATD